MKMYKLREFAEMISFHPETIRKAAARGRCGRMVLGEWRFTDEDIERLGEGCQSENDTVSGTSTFASVESEYDDLLGRTTERRRNASTTN